MNDDVIIRVASVDDASKILDIYAYYVKNTVITFEYDVPSLNEFVGRIEKTLKKFPYLVAEKNGEIIGYAYAGAFVGRAAYDWAVETTIYLKQGIQKQGIGRKLYQALEKVCHLMNIINLNACIGYPEVEDEYLTKNSAEFHAHIGYRMVGEFHRCGYKFGRWYNMVWMEKMLSAHPDKPEPIIPFPELAPAALFEVDVMSR